MRLTLEHQSGTDTLFIVGHYNRRTKRPEVNIDYDQFSTQRTRNYTLEAAKELHKALGDSIAKAESLAPKTVEAAITIPAKNMKALEFWVNSLGGTID